MRMLRSSIEEDNINKRKNNTTNSYAAIQRNCSVNLDLPRMNEQAMKWQARTAHLKSHIQT